MAKLLLVFFLASISFSAEVSHPQDNTPPTKEEQGILHTLVSIYSVAREAVKFAYDEIAYFERMFDTYDKMTNWFNRGKDKAVNTWDLADKLVTDPQDIFVTLDRLEGIFDGIDDLYLNEPYKLDWILAEGEYWWDRAARRNNEYGTGVIAPNTQAVLDYVEALFISSELPPLSEAAKDRFTNEEVALYEKKRIISNQLSSMVADSWDYEKVRKASVSLASASLANSAVYTRWSMAASNSIARTDALFNDAKGVNQKSLEATWWSIENTNANNKLIQHKTDQLRIAMALLGIDIFKMSEQKKEEYMQKNAGHKMRVEFLKQKERWDK